MNSPPALRYYGDEEKAASLKGMALAYYDFVMLGMGDALTIQREHRSGGIVIQATITTTAYGDKMGVLRIYVPHASQPVDMTIFVTFEHYSDTISPETYKYPKGLNDPVIITPKRDMLLSYWFNKGTYIGFFCTWEFDIFSDYVTHHYYVVDDVSLTRPVVRTDGIDGTLLCAATITPKATTRNLCTLEFSNYTTPKRLFFNIYPVSGTTIGALSKQVVLSSDKYASSTIAPAFINAHESGVILKDRKTVLFFSKSVADGITCTLYKFNSDYDVIEERDIFNIPAGNGDFDGMRYHGNDITARISYYTITTPDVFRQVDLYYYNADTETLDKYDDYTESQSAPIVTELLAANHDINLKVIGKTEYTDTLTTGVEGAICSLSLVINSIETVIYTEPSSYITSAYRPDAVLSFDGRFLVIGATIGHTLATPPLTTFDDLKIRLLVIVYNVATGDFNTFETAYLDYSTNNRSLPAISITNKDK